jgi:hypothetical protein
VDERTVAHVYLFRRLSGRKNASASVARRPPLPFDIQWLPDSTFLTDTETAAAIRRSKACLENWRKYADHPLKWRRVNGRVLYEITSIRALLKGDAK